LSTLLEQRPAQLETRSVSSKKSGVHPFVIIAVAAVLVRLAFMLIVPTAEAPDEVHHFWVIQFIRDHLRLPDAADVETTGIYSVYGAMPVLGYTAQIILSRLAPTEHMLFAARCGSMLLGLVTIWMASLIGKGAFPDRPLLARALPWTIVFQPQFAFLNSYCNNDCAAAAVSATVMYLLLLNQKYGLTMRRCAFIGVLLGLGILCKYNALTLIPVAVLSVVAAAWLHQAAFATCFSCLAIMGTLCGASSLWWFWRSYHVFSGDLLGVNIGYKKFASAVGQPLDYKRPFYELLVSKTWWRFIFFSFWGLFGHMTRWMWRPVYAVYIGFLVVAIAGWVKTRLVKFNVAREHLIQPSIRLLFLTCAAVNLAAVLASQLGGPQGRYFFISEVPLIALFLEGLSRLGPTWGKRVVISFLSFNAIVCIGAWIMLFRLYGLSANLP
jgi:hypothetical protein